LAGKAGRPDATGDEVVVLAQAVAVTSPQCPGYNAPTELDHEYRPVGPTGCANAVNLGLMIANPGDLAHGQALAPADGTNATFAIERYRGVQVQTYVYPYPPSDPPSVEWGQPTR
jgi:pilus assembly protein CpaD